MVQIVDNGALRPALVYLAALILIFIALTLAVINQRRTTRIGLGDGGDKMLQRWMRVHGNFTENASFGMAALIGLVLAGSAAWLVHLVGLCLIIGRLAHAQGLLSSAGASPGRASGMVLTWVALLAAALALAWRGFSG